MNGETEQTASGKTPSGTRLRQILIALDSCHDSSRAIHLAGELAAILEAELTGLFIEDEELASVAALPFSQVIHRHNYRVGKLDGAHLQRQVRLQSEKARQAFEKSAAQWRVKHSFRSVRGKIGGVLAEAAQSVDMIGICSRNWRIGGTRRLSEYASGIINATGKPVLLLPAVQETFGTLMGLIETPDDVERVLIPIARICSVRGEPPLLVITATDTDLRERLQDTCLGFLRDQGMLHPPVILFTEPDPHKLKQLVGKHRARLLVMNGKAVENTVRLQHLIQTVNTATLLAP